MSRPIGLGHDNISNTWLVSYYLELIFTNIIILLHEIKGLIFLRLLSYEQKANKGKRRNATLIFCTFISIKKFKVSY